MNSTATPGRQLLDAEFVIMPIFALANAGVSVSLSAVLHPVATGVAAGLVLGKPLWIVLASWLAVRLEWAVLSNGVSWPVVLGAGAWPASASPCRCSSPPSVSRARCCARPRAASSWAPPRA